MTQPNQENRRTAEPSIEHEHVDARIMAELFHADREAQQIECFEQLHEAIGACSLCLVTRYAFANERLMQA